MPFWRKESSPSSNPQASPESLLKTPAAMAPSIPHIQTPPGRPGEPYVLPCFTGELWTIPTSNSTMRLLVTGNETANAFAVVGTGGTFDKPIGFHFHKEAHDVFLCLKGTINVWANDKARSLSAGDFASVPPVCSLWCWICFVTEVAGIIADTPQGTIHQYQVAANHSEFIGLIIPGGWEEFFRFIGEPFPSSSIPSTQTNTLFPHGDKRNPFEVLIPKLIAATEKFDMIPVREKAHFDPQPWDGSEKTLPGVCADGGYFLKDGEGPKTLTAGTVVRAMATRHESNNRFSIYEISNSSHHAGKVIPPIKFSKVHHALYTVEGILKITIDGKEVLATAAETTFVPSATSWSIAAESVYTRSYIFADGGGMGEVLTSLGSAYEGIMVPSEPGEADVSKLKALESELGFTS